MEAEVRSHPIGRTIADICRDPGVVPGFCTGEFWAALLLAIACYDGSAAALEADLSGKFARFEQEQKNCPESDQTQRRADAAPGPGPGFRIGERPVCPFKALTSDPRHDAPAGPRHDVPAADRHAAATADATGPPYRAAMKIAA